MLREARRRQAEAERAHASLSRYFSPQIASRLASNGEDGNGMEVHRRDVATIFTDVTSFTSLVENIEPEVLSALLNEYTGGMTEIVFAHEGTVGKIIGDGIHILFNAPGDQPDYATRAVACAHDLDAWAEEFKQRWRAKGVNFGATRIGVHAGPALVGNFGGDNYFDYTAHGDTINTASRLESANKHLGTRICVSETVAKAAENFKGRPVGDIVLRGRSEPLRAYEPLRDEAFVVAGDRAIFRSLRQARGRRCRRDAGLRGAGRPACRRSARRLPSQATAQRRQGRPDATGIRIQPHDKRFCRRQLPVHSGCVPVFGGVGGVARLRDRARALRQMAAAGRRLCGGRRNTSRPRDGR